MPAEEPCCMGVSCLFYKRVTAGPQQLVQVRLWNGWDRSGGSAHTDQLKTFNADPRPC